MRRDSYPRIRLHIGKEIVLTPDNTFHLGHLLLSTHGRMNKKVWWLTQISVWIAFSVTLWLYKFIGFHDAVFGALIMALVFGIRLILNVKRLHDRGKSGYWLLLFEGPAALWSLIFPLMGFNKWCLTLLPIVAICCVWGFWEMAFRGSKE